MKSTGRPTGRPPHTEHGQYGYARRACPGRGQIGPRCGKCHLVVKRYQQRYAMKRNRGLKLRVPADFVREHVQELLDAGYAPTQIYKAAGVVNTVFDHLMVGTRGRPPAEMLERPTAEKFLNVTPHALGDASILNEPIGINRRYQALAYMGHSPHDIAEAMGVSTACLYQYLRSERCFNRTIDTFHEVYVEMRDRQGPSGFNRWKAYRLGWAPPFAWDDETIDDPNTIPHGSVCVVAQCTRPASERNLCTTHGPRVPDTEPKYYRTYVLRMSREKTKDKKRLLAELTDLKRAGYNLEAACSRIGAGVTYAEKFWGSL